MPFHVLQNFVFPTLDDIKSVALFQRSLRGSPIALSQDGCLHLSPSEHVDLATYYNGLSFRKWNELTDIETIGLRLSMDAPVRLRVICHFKDAAPVCIYNAIIAPKEAAKGIWLPKLDKSVLFLGIEIRAGDKDVTISDAAWGTDKAPVRDVNIAAVITTFKREEEVQRSIETFASTILPKKAGGLGRLFVIDNGKTLPDMDKPGVTILQNPNLGGAGGFTRGLLEAMEDGAFTHVLFMDDDAACQPESVWRTAALFRYFKDEKSAVSGAMLIEDRPTIQHEKSAMFWTSGSGSWFLEPRGHNVYLGDIAPIVEANDAENGNYGGWWFFGFPIDQVDTLTFPFFVRGDDIDFSISNGFKIENINGIATLCPDFDSKRAPTTEFLEVRSYFALALMHADLPRLKKVFDKAITHALKMGYRLDYGGMDACLAALEGAARGPEFFGEQPSPLSQFGDLKQGATVKPADFEPVNPVDGLGKRITKLDKFLSRISWNGHLLPEFMIRNETVKAPSLGHLLDRGRTHRAKYVAYGEKDNIKIYERDNARMWAGKKRARALRREIGSKLPEIQANYKANHAKYRSKEYWQTLFDTYEG